MRVQSFSSDLGIIYNIAYYLVLLIVLGFSIERVISNRFIITPYQTSSDCLDDCEYLVSSSKTFNFDIFCGGTDSIVSSLDIQPGRFNESVYNDFLQYVQTVDPPSILNTGEIGYGSCSNIPVSMSGFVFPGNYVGTDGTPFVTFSSIDLELQVVWNIGYYNSVNDLQRFHTVYYQLQNNLTMLGIANISERIPSTITITENIASQKSPITVLIELISFVSGTLSLTTLLLTLITRFLVEDYVFEGDILKRKERMLYKYLSSATKQVMEKDNLRLDKIQTIDIGLVSISPEVLLGSEEKFDRTKIE